MPWKFELRRHALLDAVDHRELGAAALGLLQQALGLVEQAGVLQRHAHAAGQRLEQAHVGVAVGVLALEIAQGQHAAHLVAGPQRHHQLRLG